MYSTKFSHFLAGGLGLLLALLFLTGCEKNKNEQAAQPPPPPEVGVVILKYQPFELHTELPGRTSAFRVGEIRPQIDGMIQDRLFEEGSDVKEGETLYQIDSAPYQVAYNSARASLGKAEANLPPMRSRVERYKELLENNAVSHQDYEDAVAAFLQAKAEIAYWKSLVQAAQINLEYTRITAPFSGRIGRSKVKTGNLVTAYQATELATVQQLDPIYVDVAQSSAELLRLKQNIASGELHRDTGESKTRVKLLLEDGTAYPIEGHLQFQDITVDPATSSFSLRIVVANPDHLLLPGMFLRAVLQEGATDKALFVPQQGVTRNSKGEAVALVVDDKDTVQQRILVIDRAIGNEWLISSGLTAGDKLIVEGLLKVRPGMQVKTVSVDLSQDIVQNLEPTAPTSPNNP